MQNLESLSFEKSFKEKCLTQGGERIETQAFGTRHSSIQTPASTVSKRTGVIEAFGTKPTSPPQVGTNF